MSALDYAVNDVQATVRLAEYLPLCVDVPRFLGFCRQCPNYGTRWACPPFDFDPMAIWGQYTAVRLWGRVIIPSAPGQAEQAALDALEAEKTVMLDRLLALEAQTPGSRALSAGMCTLCGAGGCTRPGPQSRPCRHRGQMRYSIEALGGNVGLTAEKYLGRPLLWIADGVVPQHLMLVGGLLLGGPGQRH